LPDPFEALAHGGALTADDLVRAWLLAGPERRRPPSTLVRLGMVFEHVLADGMARTHGFRLVGCGDLPVTLSRFEGLNRRFLLQRHLMPMSIDNGSLVLAMADPDDFEAREALRFAADVDTVAPVVATFSDIYEVLASAWPAEISLYLQN
jgi:general secretion pathway protein E